MCFHAKPISVGGGGGYCFHALLLSCTNDLFEVLLPRLWSMYCNLSSMTLVIFVMQNKNVLTNSYKSFCLFSDWRIKTKKGEVSWGGNLLVKLLLFGITENTVLVWKLNFRSKLTKVHAKRHYSYRSLWKLGFNLCYFLALQICKWQC